MTHGKVKAVPNGIIATASARDQSPVASGMLTTPPLEFKGRELLLNAVGPVKVRVLDDSGKTLGSAAITGDSVRHVVRFEGKSLRQVAPRRQCRLQFEVLPPGRLYSFTVSNRPS